MGQDDGSWPARSIYLALATIRFIQGRYIMNNKLSIFLIILLSSANYSCYQNNEDINGCNKSKIITLLFATEKVIDKYHLINPAQNDRQQHYRSAVIDSVDNLTTLMIDFTGGIALDSKSLFNPCYKIDHLYDEFESYKNNSIHPLYNSLNQTDKNSAKFIKILNHNFFSENSYFDRSYFNNSNINQLTYDLLTLELELVY